MMIPVQSLMEWAVLHSIPLNECQAAKLDEYAKLLVEWNEKMNLTAITEPDAIAVKHFLDSLLLLSAVPLPVGAKIIDVGTGAGFPAVPCMIVRPDLKATLLDSLNKRIIFLNTLCTKLDLNSEQIHARAEEAGRMARYREQYDLATARAVAHLRELAEYCLPFVRVEGRFVAMKGHEIEEELHEAMNAISILGGKLEEVQKYELPDGSKRSMIMIRKISQTPSKYPRPSAKIAKFGL